MKLVRKIIVAVLLIILAVISISALSGARETEVRNSHGLSKGKVIRFID